MTASLPLEMMTVDDFRPSERPDAPRQTNTISTGPGAGPRWLHFADALAAEAVYAGRSVSAPITILPKMIIA